MFSWLKCFKKYFWNRFFSKKKLRKIILIHKVRRTFLNTHFQPHHRSRPHNLGLGSSIELGSKGGFEGYELGLMSVWESGVYLELDPMFRALGQGQELSLRQGSSVGSQIEVVIKIWNLGQGKNSGVGIWNYIPNWYRDSDPGSMPGVYSLVRIQC